MAKPDEIKSYRDLLLPKWKGKMVMGNPDIAGTPQRFAAVLLEYEGYGPDFLRKFVAQDPAILKDERLAAEWLAREKNPIGIGLKEDILADLIKAGAPVRDIEIAERPISTSGAGFLSCINRPAYPSAQIVFLNWFLSKEAQTAYARSVLLQSAREDVPTGFLSPERVRQPGVPYFLSEDKEFLQKDQEFTSAAREIFGDLIQ